MCLAVLALLLETGLELNPVLSVEAPPGCKDTTLSTGFERRERWGGRLERKPGIAEEVTEWGVETGVEGCRNCAAAGGVPVCRKSDGSCVLAGRDNGNVGGVDEPGMFDVFVPFGGVGTGEEDKAADTSSCMPECANFRRMALSRGGERLSTSAPDPLGETGVSNKPYCASLPVVDSGRGRFEGMIPSFVDGAFVETG